MPNPTFNPHIRIIVKGLILCSAKDGVTPAKIGMLRELDSGRPHHKREITVIRTKGNPFPPIPDVNVNENCHLTITGEPNEITLYQPIGGTGSIDRMNSGQDPRDYRWVTSMEEVTGKPSSDLSITAKMLLPIITIDRGIFYTYERASVDTELRGVGRPEPYGFIADTLGIDVELQTGTATFMNGSNVIFSVSASAPDRYVILVDRDCNQSNGAKCRSDFTQIYKAIGTRLPAANQRDIHRRGKIVNDPEIPCLGGRTEVPLP